MKKNKIIFLIILSLQLSNYAEGQTELDYILILEGCHYSGLDCKFGTLPFAYHYMKPVNLDVLFDASFTQSCNYESTNTGWNKLLRLDKYGDHKDRSLRLGWRTNQTTGDFEIGLYAHINFVVESLSLEYYPDFNEYNKYYMRMKHNGMYVRAGDNSYCIKRYIFDPSVWYGIGPAKGAYFGGSKPAPHSMDIWVNHDKWNIYSSYWDEGANKGFGESIFYSGESYSVIADNSIKAPLVNTNNSSKYTIIESGANVSFIAGNIISLREGFHVKSGAYFHAYINSKKSTDTITNLFLVQDTDYQYINYDSTKSTQINSTDPERNQFVINSFTTFPNPHTGIFYIELNFDNIIQYTVEVIDLFGNKVYQKLNAPIGKTEINISGHPKGIYFVKVQAGDKIYTGKVVYK